MGQIKNIPEEIVAKIAAGEVIERPCFVVKELIENSLDADASRITIEVVDSGLKRISVIDDGIGMDKEDLAQSFKHHTTSKLDDSLLKIKTLGFRGEALSSIAAISNLTIISRTEKEQTGFKISNFDSSISPIGCPFGTEIIVEDLFFTVPVRKKFLKSKRTEFRQIADIVLKAAIVNPKIHFTLLHNKKTIFDFSPHQKQEDRIFHEFGQDFQEFIPIKFEDSYISISGFLAKPHVSFSSSSQRYLLFVNKRPVTDSLVMTAVKEAYGTLLEANSFPIFVLFITVPWELVDVNIHPRKEQIQFINKKLIYDSIVLAVKETLEKNNLTFGNISWQKDSVLSLTKTSLAKTIRKKVSTNLIEDDNRRPLTQLHNLYLVTETEEGIIFIDQHAAHERILYEKFLEVFLEEKGKAKGKVLDTSIILQLSTKERFLLDEHRKKLEKIGFIFEEFGEGMIKVTQIPEALDDRDIVSLLKESLQDLQDNTKIKLVDFESNKMLSYLACRSAIKAGDSLTQEEMHELLKQLGETKTGYTCPHGRPVKLEISLKEMHKLFKRI